MRYSLERFTLSDPDQLAPDPTYQLLTRCDEFRDQVLILCQNARRRIQILSESLDPVIYDSPLIAEAITRLVRTYRQAQVQILVSDIEPILERGHQLLRLAQRLPSSVELRKASAEAESQGQHFMLCDASEALYQVPASDYRGHVRRQAAPEVKRLRELFQRDWHHATLDPRLRRLHL
jgi:hypothetical protein